MLQRRRSVPRASFAAPAPAATRRALPLGGLALAVVLACASPPPPDWVEGPSPAYPADRFTVGVGAARSADLAADSAMQQVEQQIPGEGSAAVVADTWEDPDSGVHWALAALDRERRRDQLRAELAEAEAEIVRRRATADGAPPEEALTALAAAVARSEEGDRLRDRIARLGGQAPGADAATRTQSLREAYAARKRQLRIEIGSWEMDPKTGEPGDALDEDRRALAGRVLALGFGVDAQAVAWGSEEPWLRVESKVALDRLQLHPRDELVAVHWDAALEIVDVAGGGDVVALLTDQGRATHLNETEARRLADADAREFLVAALTHWLDQRVARPPEPAGNPD